MRELSPSLPERGEDLILLATRSRPRCPKPQNDGYKMEEFPRSIVYTTTKASSNSKTIQQFKESKGLISQRCVLHPLFIANSGTPTNVEACDPPCWTDKMKFIAALSFLSALAALAAADGNLLCCDTTTCGQGSCSTQIDPTNSGNGDCISLGGIFSVEPTNIDPGCSCSCPLTPNELFRSMLKFDLRHDLCRPKLQHQPPC